jgi:hypothetical protein
MKGKALFMNQMSQNIETQHQFAQHLQSSEVFSKLIFTKTDALGGTRI